MIRVKRKRHIFELDTTRVIARFFPAGSDEKKKRIINQLLELSPQKCERELKSILDDFRDRHRNIEHIFRENFEKVAFLIPEIERSQLPQNRKLLIGAYFTHEYSIESAALFNPSIVRYPDQKFVAPEDGTRYIMSFRAVGEGHISSIVFRLGVFDQNNQYYMSPVSPFVYTPERIPSSNCEKEKYLEELNYFNADPELVGKVFDPIPEIFSFHELNNSILKVEQEIGFNPTWNETKDLIYWISDSNYEIVFPENSFISERVIFPVSSRESNGIEDARFVEFRNDNGKIIYYATYTAYNGRHILPMLLETSDFIKFKMRTMYGEAAQDKDMALFPRKIDGKYFMVSRQGGESIKIMESDKITRWRESHLLLAPEYPWELVQTGSNGSPIETEHGWLLLTHGVGPMRRYVMSAILLDLDNPYKIIARLSEPFIVPDDSEREGYVPNVVYSCGSVVHNNDTLIIPYGISDSSSGIITVSLNEILTRLLREKRIQERKSPVV